MVRFGGGPIRSKVFLFCEFEGGFPSMLLFSSGQSLVGGLSPVDSIRKP